MTLTAVQYIHASVPEQSVPSWAAEDAVLPWAAADYIVSLHPAYNIVPPEAMDDVPTGRPNDDVSACCASEGCQEART